MQSIELAKDRVKTRVSEGGHNIVDNVIEQRYKKGIKNLFNIYLPIVDCAIIFDNSYGKHELIAFKTIDDNLNILNEMIYNQIKKQHENY